MPAPTMMPRVGVAPDMLKPTLVVAKVGAVVRAVPCKITMAPAAEAASDEDVPLNVAAAPSVGSALHCNVAA